MAWEDVEEVIPEETVPKYWKFQKVGDDVEGNVFRIDEGEYGPQIVLDMGDDEEGELLTTTLPAHKQLQNFIPNLKIGDYIRVELVKIIKPKTEGYNPFKIYKLQKDPKRAVNYGEEDFEDE